MLRVPTWATHLAVVAPVEGAWYGKGNSNTAQFVAGTRVGLGTVFSENGIVTNGPDDAGDRRGFTIIGRVAIPQSMRGTLQPLRLQGVRSSANTTGGLFVDYQSCISVDWEFLEEV